MNATDLFERKDTEWPASSESFWTTVFALFAMHIGGPTPKGRLTIWRCTNGTGGKWYEQRTERPTLDLRGLGLDAIAVEPAGFTKPWPGIGVVPPPSAGGFSPDLVIKAQKAEGGDYYAVIENKIASGASLRPDQMENYPRLATWLLSQNVSFDILLLTSVGSCTALYEQAQRFQADTWGGSFGVLLWEEVLQEMRRTGFSLPGLQIHFWEPYTSALTADCVQIAQPGSQPDATR